MFRCSGVFQGVPECSSVPVFWGVPVFLVLVDAFFCPPAFVSFTIVTLFSRDLQTTYALSYTEAPCEVTLPGII